MAEVGISDAARALGALRKTAKKVCAFCGAEFERMSYSKYCSPACKSKADYARHAEVRRASRRAKYAREKDAQPPEQQGKG